MSLISALPLIRWWPSLVVSVTLFSFMSCTISEESDMAARSDVLIPVLKGGSIEVCWYGLSISATYARDLCVGATDLPLLDSIVDSKPCSSLILIL